MKHALFMRFPEGRGKALTFSYDDGVVQDIRLVEILNKYGMKGTFNVNSGGYATQEKRAAGSIRMTEQEVTELFENSPHEVAIHSHTHPFLNTLPDAVAAYEVIKDRENLERQFGKIIRGMAYPMGTFDDELVAVLKSCGIAYARTTVSTEKFTIPTDWLRMPATCHHKNPRLMELAKQFTEKEISSTPILFYLWGHTYEFDDNDNWNVIEEFTDYMSGREAEIWYATNIEIYEYVQDYGRLVWSADGTMVQNPTNRTLWFSYNKELYSVAPGATLRFE